MKKLLLLLLLSSNTHAETYKLDYDGFTIWHNCETHSATKFQYTATKDLGNQPRLPKFSLDPNYPQRCQQYSANTYSGYDRGHLVPANHLDGSLLSITQSNYMTNILPQTANMNRGAWLQTEEIIECYRDVEDLLVIGGVLYNKQPNQQFVKSHGIATPDSYWKVIIRGSDNNQRVIAWNVPNSKDANRKNLDKYLVTVSDIEKIIGEKLPVAQYNKNTKPVSSWITPKGCNKG